MYSPPPRWAPSQAYQQGSVVWHSGCYWLCEQSTSGGTETPSGAPPSESPHWKLLSTTNPPASYSTSSPPPYNASAAIPSAESNASSSSGTSTPKAPWYSKMFEKNPFTAQDDAPAYDEKSADGRSRSFGGLGQTAELLSNTAADSLRYAIIQKESHDSHDVDALEDELKGKKLWKVGGVGVLAYEKDDKYEEKKKKVWQEATGWGKNGKGYFGKDEWVKASRARTNWYNQESHDIKPMLRWKLVERGGNLPDDALPVGREADGHFLYACRAWWEGGMHLGKAGAHLINNASISYGGAEHSLDIYEVLCGPSDPTLLQWRNYTHGEHAAVDGWQPVEGGREHDGMPLFIAKGEYENGTHPGKCLINDDHACIGFGGGELWVRPLQVLAYCSTSRR